jgi:hypothetical protein
VVSNNYFPAEAELTLRQVTTLVQYRDPTK